jgi:hypothetical protein
MEAVMRVIKFDKGSKRRLRVIRWTRTEILSAVFFSLVVLIILRFVFLWEVAEYSPQSRPPQVEEWR